MSLPTTNATPAAASGAGDEKALKHLKKALKLAKLDSVNVQVKDNASVVLSGSIKSRAQEKKLNEVLNQCKTKFSGFEASNQVKFKGKKKQESEEEEDAQDEEAEAADQKDVAKSALGVKEDTTEYFDDESTLQSKVAELVSLMKASKRTIVHTGAGISTSAKIPDFRGPQGVWTMEAQGKNVPGQDLKLEDAQPTLAHQCIAELMKQGMVAYVVSQNVDGLHIRSGVPAEKISELHGNAFVEKCRKCGAEYKRDYDVGETQGKQRKLKDDHSTGRACSQKGCNGDLMDTIINFEEELPKEALARAERQCKASDLAIVLGSSLTVSPARDLPLLSRRLCIVNLQLTPLDSKANTRVYARCDELMRRTMEKLGLSLPGSGVKEAKGSAPAKESKLGAPPAAPVPAGFKHTPNASSSNSKSSGRNGQDSEDDEENENEDEGSDSESAGLGLPGLKPTANASAAAPKSDSKASSDGAWRSMGLGGLASDSKDSGKPSAAGNDLYSPVDEEEVVYPGQTRKGSGRKASRSDSEDEDDGRKGKEKEGEVMDVTLARQLTKKQKQKDRGTQRRNQRGDKGKRGEKDAFEEAGNF